RPYAPQTPTGLGGFCAHFPLGTWPQAAKWGRGASVIGRQFRWNRCRVDPATWVPRRRPRGSPAFFGRKPEERTPGRKRFFLPGPTFSSLGDPAGVLLLFLPGLRPMNQRP